MECENEECKAWVAMKVPEGWKGDGLFKYGLCVMKEVVEVKRENDNLKHEVEVLKNDDTKRKDVGIYEKNENVNPGQPLPSE